MMLSVMVVGAGAAFSDQSKIKNTEAVDACTALNIIGGYPDGSFKPEGNITRAEVTKMICVALNGGKEPNLATNATPTFSDVRTNANSAWAEKYIESCYAQGIVSGVGGGKFAPAGNVTGTQLAKMLLVSLGYNPDIEKFTGNAWATNVNIIATQKGLYEGLESIDVSAALTRDNAAQMIWNALKAGEVKYEYTLVSENGTLVSKTTLVDKKDTNGKDLTLLKDKYAVSIVEDVTLLNVDQDDKGTYSVKTDGASYTKVEKDPSELMGQKVIVLVKDSDNKVFGIYADKDSKVVATGSIGQLDKVNNDTKKIKLDGTEYKLANEITNTSVKFTNNAATDSNYNTLSKVVAKKNDTPAYTIKMIDNNDDGKIDAVIVTPTMVEKVTYVGKTSVTAGSKSYKFEDDSIYDGIKKDDYAVIVAGTYTVTGDAILTKAATVEGTIEGIRTGSPKEIKIDGTWYKMATNDSVSNGDKGTFAVVNGFVYDANVSGSSKDILYVGYSEVAEKKLGDDATVEAKVYFTDGTNKTVKIDKINGKGIQVNTATNLENVTIATQNALAGQMYTYSIDSDGYYELKQLSNANGDTSTATAAVVGDTSANKNAGKIGGASAIRENKAGYDNYYYAGGAYSNGNNKLLSNSSNANSKTAIADNAVIFVKAGTEVKVVSGKTVKDWDTVKQSNGSNEVFTAGGMLTSETDGIQYAQVAAMTLNNNSTVDGANGDKQYGYLTADAYNTKQGNDDVIAYPIWNGKENIVVYEKGSSDATAEAGSAIQYHNDGTYVKVDKNLVDATDAYAITGLEKKSEGAISMTKYADQSLKNIELDKDCVFIGIDDSAKAGAEGTTVDAVNLASKDAYGNYYANAYVVLNSAGDKVLAIFFDADKLDMEDGAVATTAKTISNRNENIAQTGNSGAYTVTVSKGSAKPGEEITVTVKCTAAPTGVKTTDTVTVNFGSESKALTFTATATDTQSVTFTMGNADTTVTATVVTK